MAGIFESRTDIVLRGGLDGLAARHRAYANNIANIETPGSMPDSAAIVIITRASSRVSCGAGAITTSASIANSDRSKNSRAA